jgi:uncharacterized membrane protein HdeD (DUF308 family)
MPMHAADLQVIRSRWWLFLLLGAVLVLLGVLAISVLPFVTEIFVIYLGFLLLIGGIFHTASAFSTRIGSGFFLHLLSGLLDVVLGFIMVALPEVTAGVLTIYLGLLFLIGGLIRAAVAAYVQPPRWGLSIISGGIGVVLGIAILIDWRENSQWIIGLFVALELLQRGFAWILTALALRTAPLAVQS